MSANYIFDKDDFKFKKAKTSAWVRFRRFLAFFIASITLAIVYYIVFAVFFSTDEETRLQQENLVYEQFFAEIKEREHLLSEVISGLQERDNRIYEEIFHASAPNMDPGTTIDHIDGISLSDDADIELHSSKRLVDLERRAGYIDACFDSIVRAVQDSLFVRPPMSLPLEQFSFAQTGASVGEKLSPFYKVKMLHNGLDMIAQTGLPVLASADGVVKSVQKSRKGLGNVVTIDHGNGYTSRYAHLADIKVRAGRKVKKGTQIGCVGVSGNSFAPHLHYELLRDTVLLDPVHYFFASVDADEYVNMLIMSASTGQSMD